ncbi:MAG: sigma-70 family RNA polymerase sigma factor, partial [Balneolaceae bacterium]
MDRCKEELQLIQNILNGKREQYRVLVDRYAPLVFSVTNRFVDNGEDAEELAQEIFVKTYERLSSFKGDSKFSSWLYRIATNHCRDFAKNIRRHNTRFSEMEDNQLQEQLVYNGSPDGDIERAEWLSLLSEGLDCIKEE